MSEKALYYKSILVLDMSHTLTIDGTIYISALQAGERFGYTKDYMLLLARGEKIKGRKVGHKWYVDPVSVENFLKNASEVRDKRHIEIRAERKSELRSHDVLKKKTHTYSALLQTLVILIIGLSMGSLGFLGEKNNNLAQASGTDVSLFERMARALYSVISFRDETVESKIAVAVGENTTEDFSTSLQEGHSEMTTDKKELSTKRTIGNEASLVVVPESEIGSTTLEEIRDSFSDPVVIHVDSENSDTGIIIPHFKDTDGEAYRYLMVPVNKDSSL